MNLSLTTEYVWGPRNLEDLFKQDVSARNLDGYHLMEQIDSTFKLDSYELTCWMPEIAMEGIRRFLKERHGKISSIHAFAPLRDGFEVGNHPADCYNLSSCNEERRTFAVRGLQEVISLAEEIGARYVVVHAGFKERNKSREENLHSLKKSVQEIYRHLYDTNSRIRIGIENGPYPSNMFITPEEIRAINDFYPNIGLWFDIGHAFVNKSSDVYEIAEHCQNIIGLHLHNNDGKKDLHAPLQIGKIDLTKLFGFLRNRINRGLIHPVLEIYNYRSQSTDEDVKKSIELYRELIKPKK